MIAKRGILAVFLALVLSAPSLAANFQVGWEAYDRGDYARALQEWGPLAEQGDAGAQVGLGVMYSNGWGVSQDDAEAVKWYRLAAEQGDAMAQFSLGFMYDDGRGVPRDSAEAVTWYRLAAEQGDASAQINLGFLYDSGRGVTQDYVQAHLWFNLAAARLPPGEGRDMVVKKRDDIAERMTTAQVAKTQRLAQEWKPKRQRSETKNWNIMLLQQNLADLGYDPGPIDGLVGPPTKRAILAYQRDHGLSVDGEPSQELSDKAFGELVRRLSEKAKDD